MAWGGGDGSRERGKEVPRALQAGGVAEGGALPAAPMGGPWGFSDASDFPHTTLDVTARL